MEIAAQAQGLNTLRIPGLNVQISEANRAAAARASAVVLGVSGNMPEAKFALDLLIKNPELRGKIVFVEDFPTSNGIQNQTLRYIGRDSRLCAILPSAPNSQECFVYSKVHTVGYPDHWLPAIENIAFGIEARKSGILVKRRRGDDKCYPVGADEIVVYVSGFISFEAEHLRQILAIEKVLDRSVIVHYRAHPSEQNRPDLESVIMKRDALLEGRWEVANEEIAMAGRDSDPRLIGVSDITIANPGHVSTFYAGSLRKKMICVMGFVKVGSESSSYDYRFSGLRTHLVERVSDVRAAMEALMTNGSPEQVALEEKQKLNTIPFDPSKPPSFGKNVVDIVRSLIV